MEKFLPVSVQDFTQMITGNFVYVDKTRYVYQMVRIPQAYYFLSRPRRFGKSLLVSTLKALFEGKKELFQGLWIENSDWDWKPHPVVEIDFSELDLSDAGSLRDDLSELLDDIAAMHGLTLSASSLPRKLVKLITGLSQKHHEKVVVLVDEYDKPIINHLGKGKEKLEIAKGNRELLRNFFGVLKGSRVAANLRFVLLTGISKFSKVSIFSELNNLQDLSMHSRYASLLGYTREELEQFIETTNAILAAIPYPHIQKQGEAYYHTVFYLMVAASGVAVQTEPLSHKGRIDIAVEFPAKVYVIELKCNQSAEEAIRQIREKGYHEKYMQSGRAIHLLGINFDTEKRGVADWRLEDV